MSNNRLNISLTVGSDLLSRFFPLLAKGFTLEAQTGCSVKDLLCSQIGIEEDYLEERIQTIFLNGKALDDLNAPVVQDGSVLSLSAAMPGLAGTTLRRGGHLAAMRMQISHEKGQTTCKRQTGKMTLKLFNLTARDIGPFFLAQGIGVYETDLENILKYFEQDFKTGCRLAEVNDKKLTVDQLLQRDWKRNWVILKVSVDQEG